MLCEYSRTHHESLAQIRTIPLLKYKFLRNCFLLAQPIKQINIYKLINANTASCMLIENNGEDAMLVYVNNDNHANYVLFQRVTPC